MKIKYLLATSVVSLSTAGLMATSASAQSTGTVDFENDVIIVTGGRTVDVGGVEIPNTPKAKQVLDEEIIRRQRPGQTVNDIVNLVPGVSCHSTIRATMRFTPTSRSIRKSSSRSTSTSA